MRHGVFGWVARDNRASSDTAVRIVTHTSGVDV